MFTALITGAGRGLGLVLTGTLLSSGYRVFAGTYLEEKGLQALKEKYPDRLATVPLDVSDENSVAQALAFVAEKVTNLDIIINNAAIHLASSYNSLENIDFAGVMRTLDVNTLGPLRVSKYFFPLLEKGEGKLMVYISSEAGSISNCWRKSEFDYCMSKAALNMQAKILQNYAASKGIKVLAIHPGWMRTDMGGPDADIDPREAAEKIALLLKKKWSVEDGIYFDYEGKPMAW